MSHFVVKSKKHLDTLNEGDRIEESDFATLTPTGYFVQLEYKEDREDRKTKVEPGLWKIGKVSGNLKLIKTEFIKETVLDQFVNTQEIEHSAEAFFSNLQTYRDYGIEVPKHSILIFGPPGGGKTTTISKVCNRYLQDKETAVVVWNTDKFESWQVKDFISTFSYETGTKKLILIAEDLGGIEMQGRDIPSDSSLLSLLDNKSKTFSIPTLIISTTNHPENFLSNLTNRPERFDDKIKVNYPNADARLELLQFFLKNKETPSEESVAFIKSNKCKEFTPAHIKQAVIRSATRKKSLLDALQSVANDIETYKKAFNDRQGGIGLSYVD